MIEKKRLPNNIWESFVIYYNTILKFERKWFGEGKSLHQDKMRTLIVPGTDHSASRISFETVQLTSKMA